MVENLRTSDYEVFEAHHLQRPTRVQAYLRKLCYSWRWLPVCCAPISDQDLDDLIKEEEFTNQVSVARVSAMVADDALRHTYDEFNEGRRRHLAVVEGSRQVFGAAYLHSVHVSPEDQIEVEEEEIEEELLVEEEVIEVVDRRIMRKGVSARVVACVLAVVDSKVGPALQHTEVNRLIVRRHALKIMRDANFRHADISASIPYVVESYFLARAHVVRTSRGRIRAPKWMARALGFPSIQPSQL